MGDARFPGDCARGWLEDLGVTGPARIDVLERVRILDEQRRLTDKDANGDSIRAKRKKPAAE